MKKIRQRLFGLVLLSVCFSLYCLISQRRPWEVACPGIQDENLEHLDTRIAKQIRDIISTLEKERRPFAISSVYRSPQKQLCYYQISRLIKRLTGSNGLTTTKKSCHNNMKKGKPSSLAIDLHVPESLPMKEKAEHYQRLRVLARAKELKSGGDFKKTNPVWGKYNLGWDPGHVQMRNCTSVIKTK